ncbi:ComEC/Rec2 family competence protein [Actinotalea subterranea]|uniref:ComEC/Rec2 family competence protein n=1 Tax=Actinotalea subterranea TaxID=2607497 RepID=UPI0011EBF435|nr:ComEC/Rec2 family competence protein [Actinotalea subterranea]
MSTATVALTGCLALAVAALVTLVTRRARRPRSRAPGRGADVLSSCWFLACVVALVCVSAAAQLHVRGTGPLTRLAADGATVVVVGVVRAEPEAVGTGSGGGAPRRTTVVAVEAVTGRGATVRVSALVLVRGGAELVVPYGARVELRGRLGPGQPGARESAVLAVDGAPRVLGPPGMVDRELGRLRSTLLEVTDGFPADARGLVPGAAVGDTSRLPADLDEAMRVAGLTHVTAVSGGHFAVLSSTVLGLAALLGLPRWARALAVGAVMTWFVLLVHPEPSVLRAAAMGLAGVVGLLVGRPSRAVPALAATVVVLLVVDPWLARSYGFVLSVAATGAIVLLAPRLAARVRGLVPHWLALAIAVPVAAQAACGPVLLMLQPTLSPYAVPANVLAAPALVPATLLGVGATVTGPWAPEVAGLLARGAAGATWWIATVARTFAGLPGASVAWPGGAVGAALLAGLTAAVLGILVRGGRSRSEERA